MQRYKFRGPYKALPTHNVFNFSGGKTSAYMVLKYYSPGDIIVFSDTGREHPKTYQFINDFEDYTGLTIHKAKFSDTIDPFTTLIESRGNKMLPNLMKRFCTFELKVKASKALLKNMEITCFNSYIGFRADEEKRVLKNMNPYKKVFHKFPLYDDNITKQDINIFWEKMPFTLEIPAILGNCDLCFLKGKSAIIKILASYPELAERWIKDEENSKPNRKGQKLTYIKGISYKQMLSLAQNNLFSNVDLSEQAPAYNCSCTSF